MQKLAAALVVLLLCITIPAQRLVFAQNDNTSYGNNAVGWPAAVCAFRFTAQTNELLTAAQVFTGNQPPAMHMLEVRTHDAATGQPGVLLGAPGSWSTLHTRCWQGPTLPQAIAVTAGQDYWLVWRITGMFHQHSVSASTNPANVAVDTWISDGGPSWQTHTSLPAKFRLFAAAPTGTVQSFGTGKAGQYGEPTIGISGLPSRGGVVDVLLDNAARLKPALLLIGQPAGAVLPFAISWTTADVIVFTQTTVQSNPTSGGGDLSFFLPDSPVITGFPLTFQWAILDPLAQDGIAHTSAVTVTPP